MTILAAPAPALAAGPVSASAVLLPRPAAIESAAGSYEPGARITLVLPSHQDAALRTLGMQATDVLGQAWHRQVRVTSAAVQPGAITLKLTRDASANPESYRLTVAPGGVTLDAPTVTGLFYGLQTLRQLAEQDDGTGIAAVSIADAPRFGWRGMHLDTARHMMPVSYIKSQLDLMARYKFNHFHWHLTDDQGWRLEIKRYPKLTQIGAWRDQSPVGHNIDPYVGDGKRYGGFYTQAEVRDVVAYAKARHIEVIPEIEMPGHTVSVLAAYPELACTPGPFKVYTTWGVADDILCPSDASLTFMKNVLLEVMQLFPSSYIHLGGDEAPTTRWKASPLAQSIIKREGLKDEYALQGWFLRQVEEFLQAHGRKIIGWDEILDGKPLPSATVMSWRGMAGGIAAAKSGHDVIMAPEEFAYLDHCQGKPEDEPLCFGGNLPLKKVYAFEPVPPSLTPQEATHVLGGQANLWTEYLTTPEAVQYMLWPRGLAMAEVLWSQPQRRDWQDFRTRVDPQLTVLGKLGVHYRAPKSGDPN